MSAGRSPVGEFAHHGVQQNAGSETETEESSDNRENNTNEDCANDPGSDLQGCLSHSLTLSLDPFMQSVHL